MDKFLLRRAKEEDSKRVWEIRNQPISRKYSNNSEKIPFEKHMLWFSKKYFSERCNYCFVLENKEGVVIGYCRLDFNNDLGNYIISIALDADFQGKGFGNYFLYEVLRKFSESREIFAEIQKNNIASIKLFKKNNFEIYKEDEENYYLKFSSNT
ncbi:MAG: GNAT family N-acetyltransferase [Patescibacteria group bacterium]